jgi:hypothetical protein
LGGFRKFALAQREQRIISSIAGGEGYHTVVVAENYVQSQLPADGGFVTALANLVTAASSNRERVATLTKSISALTDQLEAKDIWAKSKEA